MFTFACIAGGSIVASTVFALLVPAGPDVTLSDIARKMETMHRSQSVTSLNIKCAKNELEAKSPHKSSRRGALVG
jgi:hypothetical protein